MDKLERNERLFNAHLIKLQRAKSVKELIELNKHEGTPLYTQKFFNKKFKGDFKKSQDYVIRQAHIGFNNSVEAALEECYY